ncbi:hypothetical protein SKAU_G00143310 [Synaphobranchus kaupii]|uniref:Uncharacterized protein n=1 Tax=Synaphobranchus kaupii TaxID=118154 RepID=A0A9Q1FSN6_SYNKA|nr:hypothetical protein SKAU_G00143310 [Synaphobranchus kaupii]
MTENPQGLCSSRVAAEREAGEMNRPSSHRSAPAPPNGGLPPEAQPHPLSRVTEGLGVCVRVALAQLPPWHTSERDGPAPMKLGRSCT